METTYSATIMSIPERTFPGRVRITAYDVVGAAIARETYGEATVYSGWISLIDDAAERVRMGVRKIVAEQIDGLGRIEARWTMIYAEDGALLEGFESRSDEPRRAVDMSRMLLRRLRWVAGPTPSA